MSYYHAASAPDYVPVPLLRDLQWQRFEVNLRHTYENVLWYRQKMREKNVSPSDIRSFDDLHKLPFLVKADLRDTYPFGMFAVPMQKIVRMHASSGTTGKPIVVAYTKGDIDIWAEVVKRSLLSYGLYEGDILHNSYGYGLFTGGLGLHYGGEALGMTVIPMSGGNTERQVMLMRDFGVTAFSGTPSYFLHILDKADEMGVDLRELPLRVGIFGAEPWTNAMRENIEARAGIKALDIYGLTEITGPGVAAECLCQGGAHIFEDHFYPEIVDPETLEPLRDGQEGELVFTTLTKTAMPIFRYRTRDITRLIPEPCPCGRTIRRMARISHRSDDMFIIRGVNVFPGQIESALLSVEGTVPHYHITLTREQGLDQVEVQVELTGDKFGDTIRSLENLRKEISRKIESTVGIRTSVRLVEPLSLPRSEGKAKRVTDLREM
ncbi:MAG: phenylacetate--CoA ligase [Planctomycetaceae bacterium]|nr:phenylacetate--CoA ligase [Planctomycetaceae bacterium]